MIKEILIDALFTPHTMIALIVVSMFLFSVAGADAACVHLMDDVELCPL